jgi:hypothetical protein
MPVQTWPRVCRRQQQQQQRQQVRMPRCWQLLVRQLADTRSSSAQGAGLSGWSPELQLPSTTPVEACAVAAVSVWCSPALMRVLLHIWCILTLL